MARTVTVSWADTADGAVYRPAEEMTPVDGDSDQVTPVLDVPLTVAVNCCVPPGPSVTPDGDTETATELDGVTLIVDVFVTELSEAEI